MDGDDGEFPFPRPEPSYEDRLVKWAHEYNAYHRLAAGEFEPFMGALRVVLHPLLESFRAEGVIPKWAGVDLLRGWAFYLVRLNRHENGFLLDEHPELHGIVDAITKHPAAQEADMPPPPGEWWDY